MYDNKNLQVLQGMLFADCASKDRVEFLPALGYYGKKGDNPVAVSRLNVSDYSENLA